MPAALTSIAQIKELLGGTFVATDDAALTTLANAANALVLATLGYDPISTAYDETQNGNGRDRIAIDNPQVTAIASVTVDGVSIPAAVGTGAGYLFDRDGIVYLRGYLFTAGIQNVRIQYTAGFATYPNDLALAATETAALRWKTRQNIGIQSKTLAQETVVFTDKDLTANARSTIQNYERTLLT